MAEIRSVEYQQNPLLFRNNIERIGMIEAFEISKALDYEATFVETPLGVANVNVHTDKVVLATLFRAGLPLHQGFLKMFDHAENAFVSAYRKYKDDSHTDVDICVEYLATPSLEGKTLIIADPMLATGGSIKLAYEALITKGMPKRIHVACVVATQEGIDTVREGLPEDITTIWCAAIDEELNANKYIVPGLGDAGDLCFGEKL
ncbi:MAG: uracil phosphoribosyltransferase [Prevotella sp.]|nr:uracil phosphoribosyltransferase [Prevotella sp.]